MDFSYFTQEEKQEYVIQVIVKALREQFDITHDEAMKLIDVSELRYMLDNNHVDYVLGTDEDYWLGRIIKANDNLKRRK